MANTIILDQYDFKVRNYALEEANKLLNQGGVLIIPSDTVYCFCCLPTKKKAIEKIAKIKEINIRQAKFSLMFSDLSNINEYSLPFSRSIYKLLNRLFPGPFTVILNASNFVPKLFGTKRNEFGFRFPNHAFCIDLINLIDSPLVVASVTGNELLHHYNNVDEIVDVFGNQVDLIIDDGVGDIESSTVIDCRFDEPEIIRQGKGYVDL